MLIESRRAGDAEQLLQRFLSVQEAAHGIARGRVVRARASSATGSAQSSIRITGSAVSASAIFPPSGASGVAVSVAL
jgi:hypothetical protein